MTVSVHQLTQIETVRSRSGRATARKPAEHVKAIAKGTPTLVRWTFLAFALTVPFEALGTVKVASSFFFLLFLFYYNPVLKKRALPPMDPSAWCFLTYIGFYAVKCFFAPEGLGRLFTLILLFVLFWIGSSILAEDKMARNTLAAYAFAASFLAIGMVLHLPGFDLYQSESSPGVVRTSVFGEDPNKLSMMLGLAAIILMGLQFNNSFRQWAIKLLLTAGMFPLLVGIAKTGSRTGTVAFAIGVLTYLLPNRQSRGKAKNITLAVLALAAGTYLMANDYTFLARWQETLYEGKTAGRENIAREAMEMAFEHPIIGWNLSEYQTELARREGLIFQYKDPHNLYLMSLLEVGMLGTIPLFIALAFCLHAAWRARKTNMGNLPLSCLLIILTVSLGLSTIAVKAVWLVFAVCIGAGSSAIQIKRFAPRSIRAFS